MKESKLDIKRRIENGLYYKEGQDWYFSQYIHPISQRSFLMILLAILSVLAFFSYTNFKGQDGGVIILPINYIIDDTETHISKVQSISKNEDSAQVAVAKYYLKDYVKNREEYNSKTQTNEIKKRNVKRIKSMSTRDVTNQYENYISIINPYSPEARYGNNVTRNIVIQRIKFENNDPKLGKAFVTFQSQEISVKGTKKTIKKSIWVSEIGFNLPVIESIIRTESPLRFLVNYYRARPVK